MKNITTIVFDMDGTVLDTVADLTVSVNYVLERFGMPEHSEEEYKKFFGSGIRYALECAVPEGTGSDVNVGAPPMQWSRAISNDELETFIKDSSIFTMNTNIQTAFITLMKNAFPNGLPECQSGWYNLSVTLTANKQSGEMTISFPFKEIHEGKRTGTYFK